MTKPRTDPIRWQPPPSRPLPEPDLTAALHVVPLPGNAPEDVVADAEGWVVAFDPDDGQVVTQLRTKHPSFGLATGVVETPGRLWLGCIGGSTICYLDL